MSDEKYQRLLRNQAHAISADEIAIKNTAEKLHELIFTEEDSLSEIDKRLKSRCCNLPLLEKIYMGYTV
ncbi:type III toxin-antitoxin system ToxN/AbiQ family toxin [Treponema sp.]|uniref:type III toxin-antitoxin system ToxN/AbiQ family toxin n=1 Tax=Treponema sp. TaxID=166 RepID=UPI00388DA0BD